MTQPNTPSAALPLDYRAAAPLGGYWTQTRAIFVDAYRDLNAKKLFWATLILSLLVVIAFIFVGINERGIKIFYWEIPGVWNTNFIPKEAFYTFIFVNLAIPFWLGVASLILALISVGGVFPDLLNGGSIDLYLAKPISRLRFFLTKYLTGLLFVALQVAVFSIASFLVIGIRGGKWQYGIFLAIPLVTLLFSYLYCVCVLLGIITRSALAAILVTLLLWGLVFVINASDGGLLAFSGAAEVRVKHQDEIIARFEQILENNSKLPKPGELSTFEAQLTTLREKRAEFEEDARKLRYWSRLLVGIKTPLPKTGETVQLLDRWLVDPDPFLRVNDEQHIRREQRRSQFRRPTTGQAESARFDTEDPDVAEVIQEKLDARTTGWILGSSALFEVVILSIAAWIFCRRDF